MTTETITGRSADIASIRQHVEGLFQAFIDRDRDAIRNGHTDDWCGFQINSVRPVDGIGQYMETTDRVLHMIRDIRFDMIDFRVTFVGEVALVCYLARNWYYDKDDKKTSVLLRALDVYRLDRGDWNQCASNIFELPDREL